MRPDCAKFRDIECVYFWGFNLEASSQQLVLHDATSLEQQIVRLLYPL